MSEEIKQLFLLDNDFGSNFESSDHTIEIDSELLTLKLLRKAITSQHP
jgi:CRISPR-associated protein Csc3